MDDLASSLGQLSTTAKEWTPGGQRYTISPVNRNTPVAGSSTQTSPNYPEPPNLESNMSASEMTTSVTKKVKSADSAMRSDSTLIVRARKSNGNEGSSSSSSSSRLRKWSLGTAKEFIPKSAANSTAPRSHQSQQRQQHCESQAVSPGPSNSLTASSVTVTTQNNPWFGDSRSHSRYQQIERGQELPSSQLQYLHHSKSKNSTSQVISRNTCRNQIEFNITSIPLGPTPAPRIPSFTSNSAITPPIPRTLHSLGLPNATLWALYRNMALDCSREMNPNDQRYKAIPASFSNAMPLEQSITNHQQCQPYLQENKAHYAKRSSFGYPTAVFKVTSRDDGHLYCLRRFDNVKCVNQKIATAVTNTWNHATTVPTSTSTILSPLTSKYHHLMDHPALIRFYKCFHSAPHRALFFIHQYHPSALTLREYVHGWSRGTSGTGGVPSSTAGGKNKGRSGFPPLQEETIWSYAIQLVSAVRAVHAAHLACRTLSLGHILVTPDAGSGAVAIADDAFVRLDNTVVKTNRVRLRINCLGVADALEYEARKPISDLQRQDVRALGRIMLSLASGTEIGLDYCDDANLLGRCDAFLRTNYSPELRNLTLALLVPSGLQQGVTDPPKIEEVCRVLAPRAMEEMDAAHAVVDGMDEVLGMEFDSGRALRILLKMGFVNERPEFGVDRRWSETGDCYVLKLFRDYVFHQADASGRPVLDLGHIVTTLNKLDAANEEKIILTSREGKSIMVVSYADVARCLQKSYEELCAVSSHQQIGSSSMLY